jgi:2-aminoethylphosphonate-pyruvate transaminase
MNRRTVLLNPGPVTLSERVRNALLREDLCHREPEFAALTLDIKARLARLYTAAEAGFEPVLLTGSGTCAVEAMLSTLAPNTARTLVVANGVYGERMAGMLHAHGKPHVIVRSDWLDPMDLAATETAIKTDSAITHVVAVHNETTTGRLNDIGALAGLCRRYGRNLMVDAVSSFGGEAIDFAHPSLLAVAATGNKCLHGIVGTCFVLARRSAFTEGHSQAATLYLDLFRYQKEQTEGYSPYTQAVHACFALQEALLELEEQGGWEARRHRYRTLSGAIRTELFRLGIPLLLPASECSAMVSSFVLPVGWAYRRLHDALREAGFVIYAGQGGLYHAVFRVCTLGDISDEDVQRLRASFRRLFGRGGGE